MILAEKHIYKPTHKYYAELDNLCFLSKNLYNATLYDIRQHYFNTGEYKNYNKVNFEFTHNNQPDLGKVNNQNFTNVSHLKLVQILKYKCQLYGINFVLQEESYTSKSSFIDKDILPIYKPNDDKKYLFLGKRIKRGLYQSKEGKFLNADVNGSYNIMRKVVGETIYDIVNPIEVCSMPYKFSVNF